MSILSVPYQKIFEGFDQDLTHLHPIFSSFSKKSAKAAILHLKLPAIFLYIINKHIYLVYSRIQEIWQTLTCPDSIPYGFPWPDFGQVTSKINWHVPHERWKQDTHWCYMCLGWVRAYSLRWRGPQKEARQAPMARERVVHWSEVAYIIRSIGLHLYGCVV